MISREDYAELQERFDSRYKRLEDCREEMDSTVGKLHNDDKRLAVIEQQQKINNWLTAAIAGGIIALVIKVFLGV